MPSSESRIISLSGRDKEHSPLEVRDGIDKRLIARSFNARVPVSLTSVLPFAVDQCTVHAYVCSLNYEIISKGSIDTALCSITQSKDLWIHMFLVPDLSIIRSQKASLAVMSRPAVTRVFLILLSLLAESLFCA